MPQINRSTAGLRIQGDGLKPAEITALLKCAPTKAWCKGDIMFPERRSDIRTKAGMWLLDAHPREPGDLDAQIQEIVSQLPDDPSVWEQINTRYETDLFCGLFMDDANEGIELSAASLKILSDRRIKLNLDLYSLGDTT